MSSFATPHFAEMRSPPLRLTGCALALLLSDCLGGQTGGEYGGMGGSGVTSAVDDNQCQARIEALPFEAPSAIGVSGANALLAFGGTHSATLSWNANTEPVGYGPERGASTIELTVASASSPIRSVRYLDGALAEPSQAGAGGSSPVDAAVPSGCPADRIEIDVAVQLITGGGALSEFFPATLEVYSESNARLSQPLALDTLTGTFAVSVPAAYSTRNIRVDASFVDGAFRGQLFGELQGPSSSPDLEGRKVPPLIIQYAQWPANTGAN